MSAISVIIPLYNAEKFIRQCLISILASKILSTDTNSGGAGIPRNLGLESARGKGEGVTSVMTEPRHLPERVAKYIRGGFFRLPWGKFYRREFLTANDISFPQMKYSEDMVFCFKCLMLAENYVRIPNLTNIHRVMKTSTSRRNDSPATGIEIWIGVVVKVVSAIDKIMRDIKCHHEG